MNIFSEFLAGFRSGYAKSRQQAPSAPTVSQKGIQARAIRHLIAHGSITAWDIVMMGTTDAHKMLTRMRGMGVLYDADDANGHVLVRNASGHGHHRNHFWTGRLPANWDWADCDRRKKPRGGWGWKQ